MLTGIRILLAEDNRSHAEALVRRLGEGVQVVHALDGREARAHLASDDAFDVVLCDVLMPRMSGFALLQWVREEKPQLEPRLVFVTADPETSLARAVAQTHRVLRKPTSSEELQGAVRAAMAKR